ncbi:hypothetical protein RchiOBHm_Chr7g0231071 [Rosa chinensis]|uniref:Uncharacterized protein n=1 Tax=Rosa chinensis TaxID=74649 RepID=A0A2P6PFJ8_ROSCH|nr:hypothetical protein RchiOBHm_Chr7g0231071 [Rosa chinensis]
MYPPRPLPHDHPSKLCYASSFIESGIKSRLLLNPELQTQQQLYGHFGDLTDHHHHLTLSSSAANGNIDRVLFQDLVEIIPLVQSPIYAARFSHLQQDTFERLLIQESKIDFLFVTCEF